MAQDHRADDLYIDSNGCLAERVNLGGQDVIIHYADIPESDITMIDGIRVTTALRTVIDIAVDLDDAQLERMILDCLERELFTVEEAMERVDRSDMQMRLGAKLVRHIVRRSDPTG